MTPVHRESEVAGEGNEVADSGRRPDSGDRPTRPETAVDRFHRTNASRMAVGLLIAVAAHFAFFELAPGVRVAIYEGRATEIETLELPPPVEVPPPPEQIARPATPMVAETEVSEDVTIAPTTFENEGARQPPPPPRAEGVSRRDRPSFIPRDVDPRLKNPEEVQESLRQAYPRALWQAGIGGRVVVWIYVDRQGQVADVRVQDPSDYDAFNETAVEVAGEMEFEPAINQDKSIGVWVSQTISFSVESG